MIRFHDGDLVVLNVTTGSDCIDFDAGEANCTRSFRVTGGTGRFRNASGGSMTLTMTVVPVLVDGPNNPVFFAITGNVTGDLSRRTEAAGSQDE